MADRVQAEEVSVAVKDAEVVAVNVAVEEDVAVVVEEDVVIEMRMLGHQ